MDRGIMFPEGLERLLVERALGEEAVEKAERGYLSKRELASVTGAMLELSDRFTNGLGKPLGEYMGSRWHRAAYFLYFLPANFVKARAVVGELAGTLGEREVVRVLDVGAGPGSLSLGVVDWFARETDVRRVELHAADSSREALGDYRFLVGRYTSELEREGYTIETAVHTEVVDIEAGPSRERKWDIILFGDCLNEIFRGREGAVRARARLLADYGGRLAEGGALVVVEPALRVLTRELQEARDIIVGKHGMNIFAPCLRAGECPMLAAGERDWCHTGVVWTRPEIVRRIDKLAGRKKYFVKFAYFAARKEAGHPVETGVEPEALRAVGGLRSEKGKFRALLCGERTYGDFTLLKRNVRDGNEDFTELARGDIVRMEGLEEKKDGMRLGEESKVRIVRGTHGMEAC